MAFQTSCVSAANIVTGLTFQQDVVADAEGREMVQHGSALFPIACYAENLKSYSVAWHWHEEFEYILAMKGPLTVDVNKTRVTLQTNQGVFLNSGILHAVEWTPSSGRSSFDPCSSRMRRRFFCWMEPCPGRRRCLPACGKPGRRLPWSPLITRTGCVIISLRHCGC